MSVGLIEDQSISLPRPRFKKIDLVGKHADSPRMRLYRSASRSACRYRWIVRRVLLTSGLKIV